MKSTMETDKDWQAEDDLRCLMHAEEVKRDSKRLKAAMALAKEKMKDLESVKMELSPEDLERDRMPMEKSSYRK
jgi:hypothetical protein